MYRITNPSTQSTEKPAVLFQHGLFSNSDTWIENFSDKAPAFKMIRAGYDVWLGNNRGNSHSLRHASKSPNDADYYNYSFSELAEYDVPAQIDKVLEISGKKSLTFIGHSQGAT